MGLVDGILGVRETIPVPAASGGTQSNALGTDDHCVNSQQQEPSIPQLRTCQNNG